jgi:hypothetical protein
MPRAESKEVQILIRLPDKGFRKMMFFNRFRVEREDGFFIIHFGHMSSSGLLLDSYCTVLAPDALKNNRDSVLAYLNRIGQPKAAQPPWQGLVSGQRSDVADIIAMAGRQEVGETCFGVFPMFVGSRMAASEAAGKTFDAEPQALLRSSLEVQRQLIVSLYAE